MIDILLATVFALLLIALALILFGFIGFLVVTGIAFCLDVYDIWKGKS